tara:strand:+ start:1982 stop:2917 length:936 start_codon:yes stop_codon:yes gene_type:complete
VVRADPLVFAMPEQGALGVGLAGALDAELGAMEIRRFPDGETYLRVDSACRGRDVVLAATLANPDALALPLLFAVHGLRHHGARRVVLAAPYLAYMRQDTRFRPGEVVTSVAFAGFLSGLVDGVVTVDPHLHRYHSLADIYRVPTRVVHAAPAVAAWIADHVDRPLLVGPDSESEQWVGEVAGLAGAPFLVLSKTRHGDRDVEIEVPPLDRWQGCTPVLVDDIVSTAATMIETVTHLRRAGYPAPVCVGVHGLFVADAHAALEQAGAATVVTSNTVPHASNRIDLTARIAEAVEELLDTAPATGANEEQSR